MKRLWLMLLFLILIYSRLVGLNWGLPYPMHPDERNIADSVTQITLQKPYAPSFWSYGGFQINAAHVLLSLKHSVSLPHTPISFIEAIIMLRLLSAFFSILTVLFIIKIVKKVVNPNKIIIFISYLFAVFSPALIQMAHFGTTESALTFFLVAIFYYSLEAIASKERAIRLSTAAIISFFLGLAVATKVTAIFFIAAPFFALFIKTALSKKRKFLWKIRTLLFSWLFIILYAAIITLLFSPHYFLYFKDFFGSLMYERALVTGNVDVFYTRQFFKTIPILFQIKHVFPYMLGLPIFILSLCGFFFLSWKKKEYNLLRIVFIAYLIPTAFLYTKWARYMTPIIPLLLIFAVLFIHKVYKEEFKILFILTACILVVPGVAYLSIYQTSDVRFMASKWIYEHIPNSATILSETANVIDVPIQLSAITYPPKNYKITQFDFYNVDTDRLLQQNLSEQIAHADYIFVPSRRVFANHGCDLVKSLKSKVESARCKELKKKYPILNDYYEKLFSENLGYKQVAEITSYPKISLFGKTIIEFPDEQAEETWTVFDHPVIRIFKRI